MAAHQDLPAEQAIGSLLAEGSKSGKGFQQPASLSCIQLSSTITSHHYHQSTMQSQQDRTFTTPQITKGSSTRCFDTLINTHTESHQYHQQCEVPHFDCILKYMFHDIHDSASLGLGVIRRHGRGLDIRPSCRRRSRSPDTGTARTDSQLRFRRLLFAFFVLFFSSSFRHKRLRHWLFVSLRIGLETRDSR